jgi:hypothetical protein
VPAVDGRQAAEDVVRVGERGERPDGEGLGEQPLAQLVGSADRAQGGVQDRDAVAQAFGLLEAMGGEEDRHAAPAELVDQLVDLAGGDRVQAGGRLVQEQQLRVAEQRPGQGDPLAEPFGQGAAGIVGPVGQVDGPQRAADAIVWVGHLVEACETLEVLGHAQAQVQARRLGHDRNAPADLCAVAGGERESGDRCRARGRCNERAERPHHGGLAGAVRPKEPEDLAVAELKRDVLERDPVTEVLAQTMD